MKVFNLLKSLTLSLASIMIFSLAVSAQIKNPPVNLEKTEQPTENAAEPKVEKTEAESAEKNVVISETPTPIPTPIVETPKTEEKTTVSDDDAKAVLGYYTNYLTEYRLGPNDIISVEVFGQCPDYCVSGKTVPPTARISYPLIREGVLVGGKTVEEVAAEITKKLDEYIIDPKVTVTLEKAMSVRYSVMGKVSAPGVRVLDRKVSLYEAIIEAGGIAKDGERKKIALIRYNPQGSLTKQIVNLTEIESGKAPMIFLNPGDQVFVPKKGFSFNAESIFDALSKASVVRLLFGSPF